MIMLSQTNPPLMMDFRCAAELNHVCPTGVQQFLPMLRPLPLRAHQFSPGWLLRFPLGLCSSPTVRPTRPLRPRTAPTAARCTAATAPTPMAAPLVTAWAATTATATARTFPPAALFSRRRRAAAAPSNPSRASCRPSPQSA